MWEYMTQLPPDEFVSYDQIIEGSRLTGRDRKITLKDSQVCPSRMRFAMMMRGKEEFEKIEGRPTVWRVKHDYRERRLRNGRAD